MISATQLDQFLLELDERRRRLTELVPVDSDGPDRLREEIVDLSEQLLIADEELRVQQEQLDETRALAESAAAGYTRFLDTTPQPLVLTDENGAVLHASRGALALSRRAPGLAPRPIATWFAPSDRGRVRTAITALNRDPDQVIELGPLAIRRSDRTEGAVAVSASVAIRLSDRHAQLLWSFRAAEDARPTLRVVPDLPPAATDASQADAGQAERLTALAVALTSAESVESALDEIADRARAHFPETPSVELFLPQRSSLAPSDRDDRTIDQLTELQHRLAQGPAIDALTGESVRSGNVAGDPRWPRLAPLLPDRVRSVLAVPLTLSGRPRAVLLWTDPRPAAFDEADAAAARQFAVHAALGLQQLLDRAHLQNAITSRQHVGQAVGILVERYRVTPAEAFEMLRQTSQQANIKVRQIAAQLIETGEIPLPTTPASEA